MHARAAQREQQWKQKALAAEQIIKQLLVLLVYCVQQLQALTRQVTWLNKQQFGSKSESTRSTASPPEGAPPTTAAIMNSEYHANLPLSRSDDSSQTFPRVDAEPR